MTATTHHRSRTQARALLALGLPAMFAVAMLAGATLERGNLPATARPAAATCRTDRATLPTSIKSPSTYERGLHRVNSPVPEP